MSTEVVGVPKGSGLGTSSILAGACVKALFEFTGITYTQEDLYDHVLCMEQLMSTGGGWQDQVGGLSMGLKYITAESGIRELTELVAKVVGYTGKIEWDTSRPNGTPRKLLDVSKAAKLGWTYKTELEDGLRLSYEDFLNNPMRAER